MNVLVRDLFSELNEIDPDDDENVLEGMIGVWCGRVGVREIRKSIHDWLERYADRQSLRMMARETSTHYVWPIYAASNGFSMVINEFKNPSDMIAGHAAIYHNHRYSFASLVLSGGYRQVRSTIELRSPREVVRINDLSEESIVTGDIVRVNHREFHRLSGFQADTVTLVVRCPAAKAESFSVNSGTLNVTWHMPIEERVPRLIAALLPMNEMEV